MTFVYLICFLILTLGVVLIFGLTPDRISDDVLKIISKKPSLRSRSLIAKGKKKSRKLTVEIHRIRDALNATGKGNQFAIACAASLLLMIVGCVLAVAVGNAFLIPVLALALALIPFLFVKRTIVYYDNHIKEELESSLSIVTSSYIRTDDIITAIRENIRYIKPPVKDIFAGFVAENTMISSDIKRSIRNLKEKINNSIFHEWCDTLIACQDDRTLKDTLLPIVAKYSDVRQANGEIKGILSAARIEYYMMVALVVANIPLLKMLNEDWYRALMDTTAGKIVIAICALTILVTWMLMLRYTKPIEYKK